VAKDVVGQQMSTAFLGLYGSLELCNDRRRELGAADGMLAGWERPSGVVGPEGAKASVGGRGARGGGQSLPRCVRGRRVGQERKRQRKSLSFWVERETVGGDRHTVE
jgi:hypothetical protein